MSLPDVLDRAALESLLGPLGVEVTSDPEPIGEEHGYASARAAVQTSVDGETMASVVKVWDAAEHGLGEIEFYGEWAPRLPIRLPACRAMEATDAYGLIVLEDLRPARQGDDAGLATREEAAAIAAAIARVHVATVGADAPLPPPRLGRLLPPEWHDSRRVSYVERWGLPDDEVARAIVTHSVVAEQVSRSLWSGAPGGLTHSDLHLDNVLFRDDGPVIIDWARPGWGPAAHDLSSVLFSCAALEDFDAVIDAHRTIAATDDDQVDGAMLKRLIIATLGTAKWLPETTRQETLIEKSRARVVEVAHWLSTRRPGLLGLLRG